MSPTRRTALASLASLAAVHINAEDGVELTFHSDPIGGDGIIRNAATDETWPTEHVMVPRRREGEYCPAAVPASLQRQG
jgi:hypothetical protein